MDTPPEEAFDRITRIAQQVFGVPISTITLIDGHRQWFKSQQGFGRSETPRQPALCNVTIRQDGPLVIGDTLVDERFVDNPFVVGEPNLRFYAGVPLRTPDGHNIGTLCAMDTLPRQADPAQVAALTDLARIVVNELELRASATSDGLTGALSRRAFRDQGASMLALAQRHRHDVSCILIGPDSLKSGNDTKGEPIEDRILVATAETCRGKLRKSDHLGRVGSEQFGVLLPYTGRASALKVAEKLRAAIAREQHRRSDVPAVTASFGVVTADRSTPDVDALLDRAETAFRAAKADGGNRCVEWQEPEEPAQPDVRRRVFKAGRIAFNSGRSTVDCTVRGLSNTSASLDVISSEGIPNEFKLQIETDGLSQLCRIATKRERHIEATFV